MRYRANTAIIEAYLELVPDGKIAVGTLLLVIHVNCMSYFAEMFTYSETQICSIGWIFVNLM